MFKNKRRHLLLVGGSTIASTLLSNKFVIAQPPNDQSMNSTTDRDTITNAVNQIAIMADLRNWDACRDAFSDRVATDYTSLTGGYVVHTSGVCARFHPRKMDSNWRNPLTKVGIPGGD